MAPDLLRQLATLVALLLMLGVNGAANVVRFNGNTTGDVSDRYPTYVTPAGYTFAVWGVIYLGLLAYVIFQFLPSERSNPLLQGLATPFILSCAMNALWLLLWHYERLGLALVLIVALLVTLLLIYLRIDAARTSLTTGERYFVALPFSIYLGWLTIATIANAAVLLTRLGWGGFGLRPASWGVIMVIVAATVAVAIGLRRGDLAFGLVIIWALTGILAKQLPTRPVAIAAGTAAALVALATLAGWLLSAGTRTVSMIDQLLS